MNGSLLAAATAALESIEREGLTKRERAILSPQGPHVAIEGTKAGHEVINLCANNYLGLADHPRLLDAAREALASHGLGMASVRFICGTSDLHLALERQVARFLATEDAILFSSCFDANGGVFETLLGPEDAVISDALNHASIIDGIRLCKARRLRYANNDMADLEQQLKQASDARVRLIATDGVFSMDGIIANLPALCELAQRHDAAVLVDDSHAVGVMGRRGAGTHEHHGVEDRIDLLTGTFGKALGGAAGGYVAGRRTLIELLRQRARPYLFSNALPPPICAATLAALELLEAEPSLLERVHDNARYFRAAMEERGFRLVGAGHPIVPVMIGDARLATQMASRLGSLGIFVTAFSFPVVPRGEARIRTQMSAAHSRKDLDRAIEAFTTVGRELGVPA
ncbi:MAG TPA: glycine C-acetyltransferase [Aestuariivirgaceae bacterium]|nr:glycine C-acetyltransferase [Aestuariivirgaceae bacterium]